MEYQEIVVDWTQKFILDSQNKNRDFEKINTNNVLYQIYGDSHIYGRDVLLYIGKSTEARLRFKAHIRGVFGFVNNLSFSIGIPYKFSGDLEIPESILIANHKPSFNKEFIHDISPEAKTHKIIVINNGNNLMLKTCCTNFWWVNNPQ